MAGHIDGAAATLGHSRMGQFEKVVHTFLERSIDDPELRKALTPDSNCGCKRGLISDEFYPTLNRDNVQLIPSGLQGVTKTGVTKDTGREI